LGVVHGEANCRGSKGRRAQRAPARGGRRPVAVASPRNPELFPGPDVPAPIPRPSITSGEATSRLHTSHALETNTPWDETSHPPCTPSMTSGLETSRLHTSHALETNTPWDETSQPLSSPSTTSTLETSRLQNSHAPTTPVISPALPLPIPQPVFKTLKGFQTVAGGKAARPPPPVTRPQNVQPPPLAEGVGGGGIPEPPQAISPDASRCSEIPRRRKKAHRGRLAGGEPSLAVSRGVALSRGSPALPTSASFCVLCGPALPTTKAKG